MNQFQSNDPALIATLDIGTSKISLTVARKKINHEIEIIGHANSESTGVKNGAIFNLNKVVDSLSLIKNKVEHQTGEAIYDIAVNVGSPFIYQKHGSNTLFKTHSRTVFTRDDTDNLIDGVYRMVVPKGYRIVHVLPQKYTVDCELEVIDPIGVVGNRLDGDFILVSVDERGLNYLDRCISRAEMNVSKYQVQPISSSLAVLNNHEKELGVCVVDIGASTTDIIIYHDNRIKFFTSIPLGSQLIDEDLVKGLGVSKKQSESIKTKLGHTIIDSGDEQALLSIPNASKRPPKLIPVANIASIIEARMAEILEAVHYEVKSQNIELEAGIVLTGGGALLPKIDILCEWITNRYTRLANPSENVDFGNFPHLNNPKYSAEIGLAYNLLCNDNYNQQDRYSDPIAIQKYRPKKNFNIRPSDKISNSQFLNFLKEKAKLIFLDDVQYYS